jgi:chromosomal replication initiation ATPase DnaA
MEAENAWMLLLPHIQAMVPRVTYVTWFKPISFQSDDGQALRLTVPNELFAAWFEQR